MLFPLFVVGAQKLVEFAFFYQENLNKNVPSGPCPWSLVPDSLSCHAHLEG